MNAPNAYRCLVVDVFTLHPLEGNPLAVFPGAMNMDEGLMQRIERELNLAETAFVFPATHPDCAVSVRIFTPRREMIVAGHPTIGRLVKAQHRHGMRPAHVHFIISAPGFKSVTTVFYLKDDPYLESDTVFGVTEPLVGMVAEQDPSSPIRGLPALRFDFQLRSADLNP